LCTPLLVLVLLFVVALGRLADARLVVADAAHQAARAASLARTTSQARGDAERSVRAALRHGGSSCRQPEVALDTRGLGPGSTVEATLTCTATLADLAGLGMPGRVAVQETAYSPVDVHRSSP
jgi:Flp pilus assembly protein TadG